MSMKNSRYLTVISLALIIFLTPIFGRNNPATLRGKVTDTRGIPLIGANVMLKGTILGAATNSAGEFVITNVPAGKFTMAVYFIGFRPKEIAVTLTPGDTTDVGRVILEATAVSSEPVVVTASKYEQNLQDVPVSISAVGAREIRYRNSITFGDALKYISGVNLNASQVNIRGSSGFSYAVGSRVLLLLDGVPLLTGDTGEINFEAVPVYLIERMEVQKAAGSALYGSNALGGVINLVTRDIGSVPQLYMKIYGGLYSNPYYDEWKWSERSRYLNGIELNYARKINKVGIMIGGSRFEDDSYRENDSRRRYSGSAKIKWDLSPFQQLTLSGNYMYQKRKSFLWWRSLQDALRPPENQLNDRVESRRTYVTAHYRHILNRDRYVTLRGVWFGNRFEDTTEETGNRSTSNSLDGEVQFNQRAGKHFLTAGVQGTAGFARSDIFGNNSSGYAALYVQDEIDWRYRLKTTIGARFDYFNIKTVGSEARFNPKLAVVYKAFQGNALRASFGTGFRAPSLAEVFTSTSFSGLLVIPNEDSLKAERSSSVEIGLNQLVGSWLSADVSLFQNDYWNLIEASLVVRDGVATGEAQFQNISRARIRGIEVNVSGNYWDNRMKIGAGYTYVDPRNLGSGAYLNYRPRHLFYSNGRITAGPFQAGLDYRFISRFDNVEDLLSNIIPDSDKQVDAHVVDLRFSAVAPVFGQPVRISFHVNNLLQYNYVEVVGALAPIRNYVLTFETGL